MLVSLGSVLLYRVFSLGPEIMIQSENGRPASTKSKCSFDYIYANGSWNSYYGTNGGGFPKGIGRGTCFCKTICILIVLGNFHKNPQYVVSFSIDSKTIPDRKSRVLLIWQIVQKFVREHGLSEMFISCVIYALTVGSSVLNTCLLCNEAF